MTLTQSPKCDYDLVEFNFIHHFEHVVVLVLTNLMAVHLAGPTIKWFPFFLNYFGSIHRCLRDSSPSIIDSNPETDTGDIQSKGKKK